jgi:amino acid permease
MMNIAAVPILNITLRNNLLDVVPIKPYLRRKNCCLFLLDDHKNTVKGIWSIILSIPVFIIVLLTRDVQFLVTYTGGFCGTFILLIFPALLVWYARKINSEEKHSCENPNKSPFKSNMWIYFTLFWATVTITCVLVNIFLGGGSGH